MLNRGALEHIGVNGLTMAEAKSDVQMTGRIAEKHKLHG